MKYLHGNLTIFNKFPIKVLIGAQDNYYNNYYDNGNSNNGSEPSYYDSYYYDDYYYSDYEMQTTTQGFSIDDPTECPANRFTSQDDYETCCKNLDRKRQNFPDCCKFPQIVIWDWQYKACQAKVKARGQREQRCNMMPCIYQYMKVIDSTVIRKGAKPDGLKYSFLLSVGNLTAWIDPISKAVDDCNRWLFQSVPNKRSSPDDYNLYWDCYETIPLYLYSVIDCSYTFN